MSDSKRMAALKDLAARLAYITEARGYNTDSGLTILWGEAPRFGESDPTTALLIVVRDDTPVTEGGVIRTRIPIEVQACVPADMSAPLLTVEAIIQDIREAVEIEEDGSIARSLDGTLPTGLERGVTRPLLREPGSTYVGASVEYVVTIEEQWGDSGLE